MDTTYLVPVADAAIALANGGDWRPADSLLGIVERRRDRLTRLEQLAVEGFRGWLDGDYRRAAAAAKEESRLLPPGGALYRWGYFELLANRPAEAIRVLADVAGDYTYGRYWSPHWWELAGAYHVLGRHRDELRAARRGQRHFPDQKLYLINAELHAQAALGHEAEVSRLLDEARGLPPNPFLVQEPGGGTWAWQAYEAALEFRAHGFREAYGRAIERLLVWLRSPGETDTAAVASRWQRAMALYAAERWDEARALYAALHAADSANVEFLGGLGASEARFGRRAEAEAIATRLTALNPRYSRGRSPYWRSRIAAVLGDRDGAVTLLREAIAQGMACTVREMPVSEACHREMDFESLRGYAPFDELLRPKG